MPKYTLLFAILASVSHVATAQVDAGSQIRQLPPPPERSEIVPELPTAARASEVDASAAGPSVQVNVLRISGQTLYSEAELIEASGFVPGTLLNLIQLQTLAAEITAFYNSRGYFLSQAYLPAQDVSSGSVTIAVVEARYGEVSIDNASRLDTGVAQRIISGLGDGDLVSAAPLERRLLLLSDIPGVIVRSTLSPGGAAGTSDLAVDIQPGRSVTGSLEADNGGNRYTGAYRFGGSVNLENPTGMGDRLSLRALTSTGDLAYGRIAYQVPAGAATVGAAFAHLTYGLGREFSNLDADGRANVASLFGSYPLVRSRHANLSALANLDASWFTDRIGVLDSTSKKRTQTGTLGLSGEAQDRFGGGGWTTGSVGFTYGNLDLLSPADLATDLLTAQSDGQFSLVRMALAREQVIAGPLTLYAAVRGQLAFDNLGSSEKMGLGGAYGVRAYPEGEAYGDEGYIATAEVRLSLGQLTGSFPGTFQLIGFVDHGRITFAHDPWLAGSNHASRSGYGAGINWFGPDNLSLRASYATRLGNQPVTSQPDHAGRFWLQAVKLF
ncbi:ShlB/FhaC/HecB family hemolysin secretion/activation protein [Altererythrobacter sp. KTW20L]|uniref:ShlB/FhaC/HecB family hemolysin secretion/activation protein n=1 Tax=Altererythrobacter sp. KTW20L TaxID=2942210 RepID=UPI0020C098B0|nr:ShlB/FhaC/HecB family hemolysin secretion/activation protein [Altererythrobacter sp. KTW20L]MCL6250838.1 ShlB/FhaC/HecB family hemolysin secretion/activation protein [Altererythrobacter sp. KTW20L]